MLHWMKMSTIHGRNYRICTDDTSMSAVRSVSSFSIEVLKFGPFVTVNHCPFLFNVINVKVCVCFPLHRAHFCAISLRFRRAARSFSPDFSEPVESTSRI